MADLLNLIEDTLGNGERMRSTGCIETDWNFAFSEKDIHRSTFHVASHLPFDVFIGRETLFAEDMLKIDPRLL